MAKRVYDIEVVRKEKNLVGEGPAWNDEEQALYWVDIQSPSIQRLGANGEYRSFPMPRPVGSFVFRKGGGLIVAMHGGFCAVDLESGSIEKIVDPEPDLPENRLNDGKCDRRGRYWCGSRDANQSDRSGSLYRLDPDHSVQRMDTGFIVSNGLAFTPDDRRMYFSDSRGETVYTYDFDVDAGTIRNRQVFLSTAGMPGRIDGATCDTDGCYWGAFVHDWAVVRFDPQGRLDRMIRLPVRHPTMCTFGGPNMDILYVTSASTWMSQDEISSQPLAGAVFAIHNTGAQGIPEPRFSG
jgi:L-arabinonolactonase